MLANAVRDRTADDVTWTLELLCQTADQEWEDDALICQHGEHCGVQIASWAKASRCPVCGDEVYGT